MADSTVGCLTSLLESVPGWIEELDSIVKIADVQEEEIMFANRPSTPLRADSKTSWSLRSKRSRDMADRDAADIPMRSNLRRPVLPHLTNSDALRLSQRKRKTASILSDTGSGPSAIRVKSAAVVYYDGDTQKRFEKLVRAIGLSRNAIRKGKMSAKVDGLSRTGSSSSEAGSSGGEEFDTHKIGYKSTRPARLPAFSRSDGSEIFDNVDSQLEKAQGFCERAAYQVLKDGDCTLEVSHAKEHFGQAMKITTEELPTIQQRAEKAVARQRRSEERSQAEEEMAARRVATALALKARLQATAAVHSVVPSDESSLEVDPLEADADSDSESEAELNVADLQFGKFSQMRTARLAAAR